MGQTLLLKPAKTS